MRILLTAAALALCGCMTTKIVFNDKWNPDSSPSYVDYFDYYWLGFRGDPSVSVQKACVDQKPYGLIRTRTIEDGLITAITLGIYVPVTIKIWCGE